MAQTVIGLFNSRQEAERALNQLLKQGFSQADVELSSAGEGSSGSPASSPASDNPWNTGKSWAPGVETRERAGKTPEMTEDTSATNTRHPDLSGSSNANFGQESDRGAVPDTDETIDTDPPRTGMGGTSGIAGSTGVDAHAGQNRWGGDDAGTGGEMTNSTDGTTSGGAGENRDHATGQEERITNPDQALKKDGSTGGYHGRDRSENTGLSDRITSYVRSLFADDEEEGERYASAAGRCSVITVHAPDRTQAERAAEILDSNGAVDVDEVAQTGASEQQRTGAAGSGTDRRRSRIFDRSSDEKDSLGRNQAPEGRKNTEDNRGM